MEALFLIVTYALPAALAFAAVRHVRRSRATGVTRTRLLLGNALVAATLASAGFAAAESYFRFVYDTTDSWGLGRAARRWVERHVERNDMGVRDDTEYARERTIGVNRVTFFGDSFTVGHGVDDVADRFANQTRRARPEWEVHVMARMGYDTPQLVTFVDDLVSDGYELDTVVLVYCLNDIGQAVPGANEIIEDVYRTADDEDFLVRHSFAVNTLYYRRRWRSEPRVANYFDFTRSHYAGEAWEAQRAMLDRFQATVERAGGRLLVVTFPFLHDLGDEYGFEAAHATLGRHWEARGVPHLDLLETFRGHDSANLVVNRYDAHPNERAHSMAAQAILPFLDRECGAR